MKVLIAEDNKIVILGLKKIFSEYPEIELDIAENGLTALNFLLKHKSNLPDFILLDLNMPIMDGIEFLSTIKKNDDLKSIPVIIHSTSNNISDIEKCQLLGCAGYFVKEVDFTKYKSNIKLIIEYWKQSKGHKVLKNLDNKFKKTS
ncbi:MAG: response regulator [Flaviramulus sp.]|nr:response regulator [Flaviramulus sp.]